MIKCVQCGSEFSTRVRTNLCPDCQKPKTGKGVQLVVKNGGDTTLQGYMFMDASHARKWMSQKFVTDASYGVRAVEFDEWPCGTRSNFRPLKNWATVKGMLDDKIEQYYQ